MDLGRALIESNKKKKKGAWKGYAGSIAAHGALIGLVVFAGMTATKDVVAKDKSTAVYLSQGAAPPPPPPPPPPPAASQAAQRPTSTPKVEIQKPVEIPDNAFIPPREIPKDTPVIVESTPVETSSLPAGSDAAPVGGVVGGTVGGVQGGTLGGEIGGVIGGEIGGVKGGTVGGTLGGVIGGTGSGAGNTPGPGSASSGPLRVGGDVKAPKVINRIEPAYTSVAKKARVAGMVIVEAVIDRTGNVDRVKVIKGLPMGLTESAVDAVKRWKFRPGTLNGRPVDVIFNLTVVFQLDSDGKSTPQVMKAERKPAPVTEAPAPAPEPAPSPEPEAPAAEPPAQVPAPLPDPPQ